MQKYKVIIRTILDERFTAEVEASSSDVAADAVLRNVTPSKFVKIDTSGRKNVKAELRLINPNHIVSISVSVAGESTIVDSEERTYTADDFG